MMRIFRFFGKLVGAVLVLVFILSMFSSIFLLAITTQLFNPDFFLEVLEEQDFFDQLPRIAATQIRYSMTYNPCLEDPDLCENEGPADEGGSGGGPPSYFQALTEEDWEILVTELLPEDWLETQIHDLFHNLIESIRTGSEKIPVAISLTELKENLTGQSGVEAISGIMKAQPECTAEDLLEITGILEGSEETGKSFLSCSPGDEFLDNYAPQIEVLLSRSLRDIPDEISLAEGLGEQEIALDALGIEVPPTVLINFVRWLILVSPLLNLLLLLLIAILAVHSFKALRVWWGYPVAIAGLLAAGVASLVSPAAKLLSENFLKDPPLAGLHEDLVEIGSGVALEILRLIFTQARNYALMVTGIGLAIIIVASVLKSPSSQAKDAQDTEEEPLPDDDLGDEPTQEKEVEESQPAEDEEKADAPDEEAETKAQEEDEEEALADTENGAEPPEPDEEEQEDTPDSAEPSED